MGAIATRISGSATGPINCFGEIAPSPGTSPDIKDFAQGQTEVAILL